MIINKKLKKIKNNSNFKNNALLIYKNKLKSFNNLNHNYRVIVKH